MRKLIVANWKLNPRTFNEAAHLVRSMVPMVRSARHHVVFCPPVAFIAPLKVMFPELLFGAQDTFEFNEGPHTGSLGSSQIKSVGARFVIIGHSEYRTRFAEKDGEIPAKIKAALKEGLVPILCVGESLSIRRKGVVSSRKFVLNQLKRNLKGIVKTSGIVIAYEPVWAISTSGSGREETPEDAVEMIRFIKRHHRNPVLYGGSVNPKNAAAFLGNSEIDGALVGAASLNLKNFTAIIQVVD